MTKNGFQLIRLFTKSLFNVTVYHSNYATVLSDMTVVNNETRKQLMDKVPNRTEGGTCIGCGLQMAIDVKLFTIHSCE